MTPDGAEFGLILTLKHGPPDSIRHQRRVRASAVMVTLAGPSRGLWMCLWMCLRWCLWLVVPVVVPVVDAKALARL